MKSLLEKAVLASIGMVMLYAATVAVWFLFRADACKKARAKYQDACDSYEFEKKLISEKRKWFERYDEESAKMPLYDPSVSKWAKIVDIAKDHDISIARANTKGDPEDNGDVVVLVIDTNGWTGGWESLVNFIYEHGRPSMSHAEPKIGGDRSGTGDVFASVILGDAVNGIGFAESVRKASTFTANAVRRTVAMGLPPKDGLAFEEILGELTT